MPLIPVLMRPGGWGWGRIYVSSRPACSTYQAPGLLYLYKETDKWELGMSQLCSGPGPGLGSESMGPALEPGCEG